MDKNSEKYTHFVTYSNKCVINMFCLYWNDKGTRLEAHGEVLDLFVHVLLFLQSDCCFIQPGQKDENRLMNDEQEGSVVKHYIGKQMKSFGAVVAICHSGRWHCY